MSNGQACILRLQEMATSMNVLGNTKLSHRLMLLVMLTALPFVAINVWTLLQAKDSLLEQKKLKTRHVVETAHSLLGVYAAQVDEGVLSEAEAQTQAMNAVKRLRYEDKEYFWINDMQVQMVMHPYKPQLDGTDLSNLKDPTGKKPFVEFVAAARDGGGFVDYMWPKPGADDPVAKVSYVKKFEPWQWVVGSGIYIDDVDAVFWSQARQRAIANLLVIALVAFVGIMIAGGIARPLRKAVSVATNIANGRLDNNIESETSDETGVMLDALRSMQTQIRERIENDQRVAAETDRLKRALDKSEAKVMVTDNDQTIIYMTDTVEAMFRAAQDDLRKDLPGFDINTLMGKPVSSVYPTAAGRNGAQREDISLGGHIFRIISNPIVNGEGERIGSVFEWDDITNARDVEIEVQNVVESVMAGDLSQRIPLEGKDGLFATLSGGINDLVQICDQVINDTVRMLGAMANGDLSQSIETEYSGAFAELKTNANATMAKLSEVLSDVKFGVLTIEGNAGEISTGTANLASRIELQSSRLEQTASSMEQMTGTVKNNADNAVQANELASSARDQAERGGAVVSQTVAAMAEINRSSEKISDITSVIDEIAFQTNLLALNAAVEAARAGEQGRGFAVVANEVRGLAQRSAEAAKEIKELIEDSVQKVDGGSRLVDESGKTLEEIVQSVTQVSTFIADIAEASREQSAGIDEVSRAVTNMDEMTQQNASLVQEAAAASQSMRTQVQSMSSVMSFFKVGEGSAKAEPFVERRSADRPWSSSPAAPSAQENAPDQQVVGSDVNFREF